MTFEQALKRLAENKPEKFGYVTERGNDYFRYRIIQWHIGTDVLTQDDIDAILAEIGWVYGVELSTYATWQACLIHSANLRARNFLRGCETKLEAAKAALVAVVEREYPL